MPGGLGAFAIVVAAGMIALALLLVWLLSRDKGVSRTSFGFYVARDRYVEDESPWPQMAPTAEHAALPQWPDRDKTTEIPPKEEEK